MVVAVMGERIVLVKGLFEVARRALCVMRWSRRFVMRVALRMQQKKTRRILLVAVVMVSSP
jgi:hypothetical protein